MHVLAELAAIGVWRSPRTGLRVPVSRSALHRVAQQVDPDPPVQRVPAHNRAGGLEAGLTTSSDRVPRARSVQATDRLGESGPGCLCASSVVACASGRRTPGASASFGSIRRADAKQGRPVWPRQASYPQSPRERAVRVSPPSLQAVPNHSTVSAET